MDTTPRKARKVAHRAEAQALLEAWATSGLQLGTFARRHGIDGRSPSCWRLNPTREQEQPAPVLRLVELALPRAAATYRVRVGEVELEVDDHFDDATLTRLLTVVRAC